MPTKATKEKIDNKIIYTLDALIVFTHIVHAPVSKSYLFRLLISVIWI